MRLRCREGELALIIREESGCEANIGRAVCVSGPLEIDTCRGPTWLIAPATPEPWFYLSPDGEGVVVRPISHADRVEHPDAWLLPLRPDEGEPGVSSEEQESEPQSIELR